MESLQDKKYSLEDIKVATNDFSKKNIIGQGGFGKVYRGKLSKPADMTVAVKRLEREHGQGEDQFNMELEILALNKHENMINFVGFCKESDEYILVYEYAKYGSLGKHLSNNELSWRQRLQISIGAARCLCYLHNDVPQYRVLHRDIKSTNILLSENWEAKISDFGLSKIIPSNVENPIVVTNACGTNGYVEPQYALTDTVSEKSDVFSFGVVLFEILCGKLTNKSYEDHSVFSYSLAKAYYKEKRLVDLIHPNLQVDQIDAYSFKMFSMVAYNCLKDDRSERSEMKWIVERLEKALKLQDNAKDRSILIGTCGRETKSPGKFWSFKLEENHRLSELTINHDDDVIYSLMFTSECGGVLHNSDKVGRVDGGGRVSKVTFKEDEILKYIKGTINKESKVISSLSLVTNEETHGPFGVTLKSESSIIDEEFCIPWGNGCLDGFYGYAGSYIDGVGVYVKPSTEIVKTGTFGGNGVKGPKDPKNWTAGLEGDPLKTIKIDHGSQIFALLFKSEGGEQFYPHGGAYKGGTKKEEVTFDLGEEIHAIHGTVGRSNNDIHPVKVLTSIAFVTNKEVHGPFGEDRGTPFAVECEYGEFVDFYGICGFYIDSIGILLNTSTPKTLSRASDY